MRIIRVFAVLLVAVLPLFGQPREGRSKELSFSGSYQNYSSANSSSNTAFLASTRLGFFLQNRVELEPEMVVMLTGGSEPVYILDGNVSYNFVSSAKGVPFLLIGYGVANTVPFFNVPSTRFDFRIGVLDLGGGLKVFFKEDVALRIEYRYQRFSGEGETTGYGPYSFTQKVDTRIHTVHFGFSILL